MHIRTIFSLCLIFLLVFAKTEAYFFSENGYEGLCVYSSSTCTLEDQKQLQTKTIEQLTQKLQDRIIVLRQFLLTQLTTMKDFFSKSIRNSHLDLDSMFSDTYGSFYHRNVEIINKFFNRINSFTSSYSEASMKVIVDSFFDELFRVMFNLTNPFYSIDEEKWQCMEKFYREISAFEDIPQRVTNQLLTPLTNWRHFMASLETVHNILDGYLNITLKEECQRSLTKMETCAVCQGIMEKPCSSYCVNVLSGCTYQMLESESTWKSTVEKLIKLANTLNNRQNLVSSVQPIPILISEAIMHFQEKKDYITNKMIGKCLYDETNLYFRSKRSFPESVKSINPRPYSADKTSKDHLMLNQIFQSFISKMKEFKAFFKNIPETLCESDYWATKEVEYCWNGTSIGAYRLPIVNSSLPHINPEYRNDNFLTFRGNYVEERLRLQWLQSRLSNILSTNSDSKHEDKTVAEPYIRTTDDEDYEDEDYEGSAIEIPTASSETRFSATANSFKKVEVVIEPYPVKMDASRIKISILLVSLVLVLLNVFFT